jgi:protein-disulfide isomerase
MKVTATPSFFINGEAAANAGSIETMRKALDTVLGGKSLSQAAREEATRITSVQAGDMVLGKRTAKITLVEFINIGCPHCADFHKRLVSSLQKGYLDTGKVKLVYRPLLLSPATFYANMIASCRSDPQFFPTLDVLIDNVQSWSSTTAFLTPLREAAEKAGISAAQFYPCLENKNREARILGQHREASERLGLRQSPSLYLNGESIEAHNPIAATQAIDQLLAKKP